MASAKTAVTAARTVLRAAWSQRPLLARNALLRNGTKEALSARTNAPLLWYSCGPTVYDDAHLGHARAYVSFDIIRRVVQALSGARTVYAMGVTDVDDKILARAAERAVDPIHLARGFERRFFEDMNALNVLPPSKILRVTEHIPELVEFIEDLIRAGAAYAPGNGDVYFAVAASGERYGQLDPSRGLDAAGSDSDDGSARGPKRDRRDFALWKGDNHSAESASLAWDSPWGRGRPGWHVECSAMATAALGDRLDIHTGGIDLRFPHHTNELATAEAALCCGSDRWTNTWLHAGHLHLAGHKMSKSVKNFVTIREFLENGGSADAFRVFCLLHRYSAPVEYSEERLSDAESFLARMRRIGAADVLGATITAMDPASLMSAPRMHSSCKRGLTLDAEVYKAQAAIEEALTDDFDTPRAMAALSQLTTSANSSIREADGPPSGAVALSFANAARVISDTLTMLGISATRQSSQVNKNDDEAIDAFVQFRAQVRNSARKKDIGELFKLCDQARDTLQSKFGARVTDLKKGSPTWSRD